MSTIAVPDRSPATSLRSASTTNLIGGTWVEGRGNTTERSTTRRTRPRCWRGTRGRAGAGGRGMRRRRPSLPGWRRHSGSGSGPCPVQVPGSAGKALCGRGTQHRPRKRQALERSQARCGDGLDVVDFACGIPSQLMGQTLPTFRGTSTATPSANPWAWWSAFRRSISRR